MQEKEQVILVTNHDEPIGLMPKLEAHQKGELHRAFSVFIFNPSGQLLLQRRAKHKYHSPGLWTNTCCSHPREGEDICAAGSRRLQEEMGFTTSLSPLFSFIYKANFDNGLIEHEFDHVLIGYYNRNPLPNPEEVSDWKWETLDHILEDVLQNSKNYTVWFRLLFKEYFQKLSQIIR